METEWREEYREEGNGRRDGEKRGIEARREGITKRGKVRKREEKEGEKNR